MGLNEVDTELEQAEEAARRHHRHPSQPNAEKLEGRRQQSDISYDLKETETPILTHSASVARVATARDDAEDQNAERQRTLMSRTRTAQSVHIHTIGADPAKWRTKTKEQLPGFGAGKEYPPPLPEIEKYVVDFTGYDDPMHPQNWSNRKKYLVSAILALTSVFSAWGSSIFSPAIPAVAREYGVSAEVATLGVSLYVLGFATGPLIWAPLSELYGRRLPIIIGSAGFAIFQIAVASAENLQTIIICRFFSGLFAACPLAVVGGAYADIWDNAHRGNAINIFSLTVSLPALLAPIVGAFIVESHLGWRWTSYITAMIGFALLAMNIFFLDETYAPIVLVEKAKMLRRQTKNWGIHAKQEQIEVNFGELIQKNLSRPIKLLFTEPIVFFVSLYVAFIYGMLYLLLTAFPIVFLQYHRISGGKGYLPFLGLCVGQCFGALIIYLFEPMYKRALKANKGIPVPEARLPASMVGAVIFPIGLFWFAWTGNYPQIHWIVPTLSGVFIGCGIFIIFLTSLNYIIDAYLMFAASAIAANAFLRSILGATFPLFATYMFKSLHVNYAGTVLGCVAVVLMPCPFIFYKYGKKIRARSKYAPTFGDADD